MRSNRYWILIAILLVAFCLRLIVLNTRPVWYDEAFAVFLSEQDYSGIVSGTVADTMPPLYYALLHNWIPIVGETPFALRMLSVALSMLVVALTFAVASRAFGWRAGTWAAFFTALAPFEIYYGQELRMYGLLALASLLYLYAVMRLWLRTRHAVWLVALATALALYSHNLAGLTLIAANIFFALKREWKTELSLLAGQSIGGLFFVPWLFYVPTQLEKIQRAFWTLPPGIVDILQMLTMFTTYLPLPTLFLFVALFVSLAVCAFAAVELFRWYRRGAPQNLGLLLAFVLIPPVLMFALSYVMRPIFVPRGAIVSSLAYYVLLAGLVARAPRPGAGQIAIGAVAVVITFSALFFLYTSWGEWRRAPFDEADQFLRSQMQPGDLILHDNKLAYFPMHFYDRTLPQEFLADPPGTSNDTFALATQQAMRLFPVDMNVVSHHPRVWFVIFQTAIDEAIQEGHSHGNLSQLDASMQRGEIFQFGDLRIYRYDHR